MEFLTTLLQLSDIETLETKKNTLEKINKQGDKKQKYQNFFSS